MLTLSFTSLHTGQNEADCLISLTKEQLAHDMIMKHFHIIKNISVHVMF